MLEISTNHQSGVRVACADDAEGLLNLCRMMHAESGYKSVPFNADKARKTLEMALPYGRNDFNSGCAWVGVIGTTNELFGSSYLRIQTPWYSDAPYLEQLWTFVRPDHRKSSSNIRDLISFGMARAECMQMPLKVDAAMLGPGLGKLYTRFGFESSGNFYSYNGIAA